MLDVFFLGPRGTASRPPSFCSSPPSAGITSTETGRDAGGRASLGRRRGFQMIGEGWSALGEPFANELAGRLCAASEID